MRVPQNKNPKVGTVARNRAILRHKLIQYQAERHHWLLVRPIVLTVLADAQIDKLHQLVEPHAWQQPFSRLAMHQHLHD